MKRVFKINERVWFEDDHTSGWGILVLVNGEKTYPEYICSDDCGDILTIAKDEGGEIETTPGRVYQMANGREFQGFPVVWEHSDEGALAEYSYYCPDLQVNCFQFEVDWLG